MFDKDGAFSQQVDKAGALTTAATGEERFYPVLKVGYLLPANAEDIKNIVPKGFGFGLFADLGFPFFAKRERLRFDFIPAKGHGQNWFGAESENFGLAPVEISRHRFEKEATEISKKGGQTNRNRCPEFFLPSPVSGILSKR